MSAFQTTLFPLKSPDEIRRLNHASKESLQTVNMDIMSEIDRIMTTITPVGAWGRLHVHYAGDIIDVIVNLRGWNDDLESSDGRKAWGRRSVAYFAYDPVSGLFAPSKFCAYVPILPEAGGGGGTAFEWSRMTAPLYSNLNDGTHIMDGTRAWRHLTVELGMRSLAASSAGVVTDHFIQWHKKNHEIVKIRCGKPIFLVPPPWYTATYVMDSDIT